MKPKYMWPKSDYISSFHCISTSARVGSNIIIIASSPSRDSSIALCDAGRLPRALQFFLSSAFGVEKEGGRGREGEGRGRVGGRGGFMTL